MGERMDAAEMIRSVWRQAGPDAEVVVAEGEPAVYVVHDLTRDWIVCPSEVWAERVSAGRPEGRSDAASS